MNLSRRGFLGTLVAAAVGASANFDLTRKLWVPEAPEVVAPDFGISMRFVKQWDIETLGADQLELNDLALRFAQRLGQKLKNHRALVLRTINCELAGTVEPGLITLDDGRRGNFDPHHKRIPKTLTWKEHGGGGWLAAEWAADSIAHKLRQFDAFAPVSRELRPGVQFEGSIVGVATDPETGISARAIRFENWNGGQLETVVSYEVAGGEWIPASRQGQRRWGRMKSDHERGLVTGPLPATLLAPELQQEAAWQARAAEFTTIDDDGTVLSSVKREDA